VEGEDEPATDEEVHKPTWQSVKGTPTWQLVKGTLIHRCVVAAGGKWRQRLAEIQVMGAP
jgi:hypothetical protein